MLRGYSEKKSRTEPNDCSIFRFPVGWFLSLRFSSFVRSLLETTESSIESSPARGESKSYLLFTGLETFPMVLRLEKPIPWNETTLRAWVFFKPLAFESPRIWNQSLSFVFPHRDEIAPLPALFDPETLWRPSQERRLHRDRPWPQPPFLFRLNGLPPITIFSTMVA